jgi:hypothetical protein
MGVLTAPPSGRTAPAAGRTGSRRR